VHRHLQSGPIAIACLAVSVALVTLLATGALAQVSPGEIVGPEQAE